MWHFKAQQESYETKCLPHVWPAMPGLPNARILRGKRGFVPMYEVQWLHSGKLRYYLLFRASGIPRVELHGSQLEQWFCVLCHRNSSKAYNDSCGGNVGAQKETVSIWYLCHSIMLSLHSVVYGIPLWNLILHAWIWLDVFFWPVHGRLACQCYLQLVSLRLFCSISSLHLNPDISNGWWI